MTNKTTKRQPTVRLSLRPGLVTPAEKQAWKIFWKILCTQVQNEGKQKNFTEDSVPNVPVPHKSDIPDYPTHPCYNCGCGDYWLTDWNEWLCSRCRPKAEGGTG